MELFIRSTKQVAKRSLTSVLGALSKLAFGQKQKISKAKDGDGRLADVQICSEMKDDIFKYFQLAEVCKIVCHMKLLLLCVPILILPSSLNTPLQGLNRIPDYMESQPEFDARRRAKLADSLIWVNDECKLSTETLYLTFYIVDKYLSLEIVKDGELALLAATATLIACKYEENRILEEDGKYVRNRLPRVKIYM